MPDPTDEDCTCMWCDYFATVDGPRRTSIQVWGKCHLSQAAMPEDGFCADWKDTPLPTPISLAALEGAKP